ncbi:hypothetical protein Tco_0798788 [Tanacetum coccineum]
MTAKDVKSLALWHGIPLDLHPVALTKGWTMDKLPDDMIGGLTTTWDFLGFCPVFKDIEGNVVTMSEYLRFPFLSGATIDKGTALTNQDRRAKHTVHPLPADQAILEKTDHEKEAKVEDPKIFVIRERKARAAAKKKSKKRMSANEGEVPIRTTNPGGAGEPFRSRDHSVHPRPTDVRLTATTRSAQRGDVDEGESSRHATYYVLEWFIHQRCRVDTPMWFWELMVHLAPPVAQEDSNALNNATALKRAWFALGQGALA